jgi:diguanylate cyclase (GGDEF)-like protein
MEQQNQPNPSEEIRKLQTEVEKIRSQFYIFYELTKAMRTTLRLDEIAYIILTGLTAGQGLAFNRAVLFLVDSERKKIDGFMGIGQIDAEDAGPIWHHIEEEKKDLYELIKAYHKIKEGQVKPKFMEFVQSLSFPLVKESGLIFDTMLELTPMRIKEDQVNKFANDPLVKQLQLHEFLIAPIWIKNKPEGVILVDNSVTKKPISDENTRIFNMFVDQATGAIENSKSFEDTLIKAHTDLLTNLWNHGCFQYKMDEELAKAKTENKNLSVLMIDLDDFKKFNDTYGHIQGDKALQGISGILRENCRRMDILCRYGGEEFSFILPYTKKEEALFLAERIRKSIQDRDVLGTHFTVSIGISSFPQDAVEKELLVKRADEALYRAKKEGKNKVTLA